MKICFLLGLSLLFIGCANIFEPAANKTSDEALLEDAKKAQNNADYDTAIAKILLLQTNNAAYQSDVPTKMLLASAYAGKCGFNFANYYQVITSTAAGTTPILKWFMNQWTLTATSRAYCRKAEDVVKSISPTYVGRDANQSFFMVLLGLAKIGIYLRELADTDKDGVADQPPFDLPGTNAFCSSSNISDADIAEIGAGIAMVIANLTNIGTTLSGASLGSVSTFCTTLGAPATNPCYLEDESVFVTNSGYVKTIRSALNVNISPGIGLVNGLPCP